MTALLRDGDIVAAAQEERFSRKKHDPRFPAAAARYCLAEAGISLHDVDYLVFYDKPLVKFERLLETYLAYAPRGFPLVPRRHAGVVEGKLYLKKVLRDELTAIGGGNAAALPPLLFTEHHQAHAASAFFPSPFAKAAVLRMDGVGEWATTSVWLGEGNSLTPQWEIDFPHSLGLLYSAFTYFTGFKVNSGEYKLMGLAPYGEPKYVDVILDRLVSRKEDGTFRLNMEYFNYTTGMSLATVALDSLRGIIALGAARAGNPRSGVPGMDAARAAAQSHHHAHHHGARVLLDRDAASDAGTGPRSHASPI